MVYSNLNNLFVGLDVTIGLDEWPEVPRILVARPR